MQQEFRKIFSHWGCPGMLRVDNGAPWGSCNDLPPQLALWIIGLGIEMHWNTPGRPQENGVIERSQGLAVRWAEPKQCLTLRGFQKRIDAEDHVQRERYPALQGKTRLEAYPELQHSGRNYSPQWEKGHWNWNRVLQHLSLYAVMRKVDGTGKIGHYGRQLYVGTIHKQKTVMVQFDPDLVAWIITDQRGCQLRQIPAELTATMVQPLTVPTHTTRS